MNAPSPKTKARPLLVVSILLSLAGLAAFILIFGRDFNIYLLILSPVIITLYQLPAVYVFWLYRKRRAAGAARLEAGEKSREQGKS